MGYPRLTLLLEIVRIYDVVVSPLLHLAGCDVSICRLRSVHWAATLANAVMRSSSGFGKSIDGLGADSRRYPPKDLSHKETDISLCSTLCSHVTFCALEGKGRIWQHHQEVSAPCLPASREQANLFLVSDLATTSARISQALKHISKHAGDSTKVFDQLQNSPQFI